MFCPPDNAAQNIITFNSKGAGGYPSTELVLFFDLLVNPLAQSLQKLGLF
jgi:hypothetical protein